MKKKRFHLFLLIVLLTAGCQSELANRYLNPDKTTSTTPDKLFTAILNNERVWPSYWNTSTFVNWHIGVYSQTVGFLNSETVYQQNESYIEDRWNDFYRPSVNGSGIVALYREMQRDYNQLSALDQKNYEVFLRTSQVLLYDQATQMVDLWGDIPFSEAGMLNLTGEIVYPKFDDASAIYQEAIQNLKTLGDYFASATLSSQTQSTFTLQDIQLSGNLDKWRRYTNSLRLRLLMRLSFVDEPNAQSQVLDLLADGANYPLLNEVDYKPSRDDILLAPLSNYADDLHLAFNDWTNYPAPWFMLEQVLKPAQDLRIPVLFDKYGQQMNNQFTPNAEFGAMPLTLSRIEQQSSLGNYAVLDSTTFLFNNKLPGIVMTTSEVNFLKAEAFERWGGGDAAAEYQKGIRNSIQFYFYLNNLNKARPVLAAPTSVEIDNFLSSSSSIQYQGSSTEKLSKIWTQKWVHFGVLQATQSWAELRRTGAPALIFTPATLSGYELPPARLTYPSSEKTYNKNYGDVASRDSRTNKIFWAVH